MPFEAPGRDVRPFRRRRLTIFVRLTYEIFLYRATRRSSHRSTDDTVIRERFIEVYMACRKRARAGTGMLKELRQLR